MLDGIGHELRLGAFITTLAGGEQLEARSPELEAQRAAARRGLSVERALLLADVARAEDADVRELADLDERAGVRIHRIITATSLPPVDLPRDTPRFALLDDELVCTDDGSGWRVSKDRSDLERARAAAEALRHVPPPVMAPSTEAEELVLAEPLIKSAPFARALAQEVCQPVGVGMPDCAPYHGWVQYMRLLDMVRSPQHRGQFFHSSLGAAARSGKQRVLVAGAADYSMLAHVLAAYKREGRTPEVTVIDRCPTPLRLSQWYAELVSAAVRVEVADVCAFRSEEPFDAICTDALLVMLPAEAKRSALAHLAGALRPGGRLITTLRIEAGATGGAEEVPEEAVAAFAQGARRAATRRAGLVDVDPDLVERQAQRYMSGIRVYPAGSREELIELFEGADLRLEQLDVSEHGGPVSGLGGGPGVNRTATYARVVATRD
jgi:SAM-dependent methyltransferase